MITIRPGPAVALALVAHLAVACTGEDPVVVPPASATADEFIAAWTRSDGDGMVGALSSSSRAKWPASRLDRWLDKTLRAGGIDSLSVSRLGIVMSPREIEPDQELPPREVEYVLTYSSSAAAEPPVFEGSFELEYSSGDNAWELDWSPALMWPGIPGARGFEVELEWPRRGTILDRDGRALARGTGTDRSYPFGSVAGTTIGHVEPATRGDLGRTAEENGTELVGGSGLEAGLEDALRGTPGARLSLVDRRGRLVERLGRRPAAPARPIKTTLDMDVQQAAEAAYGGTTGGAVVLDPSTGDLLAVVSSSPFDPNNYVGVSGIQPFNRALSGLYPPGSSLKVMTASAALDTDVVDVDTEVTGPKEYKGVRNFESGKFGTITFGTALKFSVNTAFAQVAEDLGAKRITRYAKSFGFNREPKMPLGAARSSFPFPEGLSDLMWGSIGQAQVLASPFHMATVAATVANGGVRMEPRILLQDPRGRERVMGAGTAATMTGLMEDVVEGGTGVGAAISGVRVAGKTGTAEVDVAGERKNHAWFIAFAPADAPRVVVAVVSEYGGVGGEVAAPLARGILQAVLPLVP